MNRRAQRRAKIRATIKGTADKPRLVVFRSNKYFYAQLINDAKGETVGSSDKMVDVEAAARQIAGKALRKKVKKVIFDRAGYKYHGKVKLFAEAARSAGLEF